MFKYTENYEFQQKEEADNFYVLQEYQKLLDTPNWQEERQRVATEALFALVNNNSGESKPEINPFYLGNIPVNTIDRMEL